VIDTVEPFRMRNVDITVASDLRLRDNASIMTFILNANYALEELRVISKNALRRQ
jgi:hypothetical protein